MVTQEPWARLRFGPGINELPPGRRWPRSVEPHGLSVSMKDQAWSGEHDACISSIHCVPHDLLPSFSHVEPVLKLMVLDYWGDYRGWAICSFDKSWLPHSYWFARSWTLCSAKICKGITRKQVKLWNQGLLRMALWNKSARKVPRFPKATRHYCQGATNVRAWWQADDLDEIFGFLDQMVLGLLANRRHITKQEQRRNPNFPLRKKKGRKGFLHLPGRATPLSIGVGVFWTTSLSLFTVSSLDVGNNAFQVWNTSLVAGNLCLAGYKLCLFCRKSCPITCKFLCFGVAILLYQQNNRMTLRLIEVRQMATTQHPHSIVDDGSQQKKIPLRENQTTA